VQSTAPKTPPEGEPLATDIRLPDGSLAMAFAITLPPGYDLLLTRKEVARLLRVSEGYLRHRGDELLPAIRIGGAVRHRLSAVLAKLGADAE
jgi:hypothetical protein